MKFVHIADLHFDMPFVLLTSKDNLDMKRRVEQKQAFDKVINYIKENNIELLFISGDLYENEHVKNSTIDYINNSFKQIPNTQIYISPGNHDPYLKNSMYNLYEWADNVTIFNREVGKYEEGDIDIYGIGFDDFTLEKINLDEFKIQDKSKTNILIIHAAVDSSTSADKLYNPITLNELKELGFDYIALGHIHKREYKEKNIIYPGSLVALGFDEPGEHGMIVGNIENGIVNTEFIKLDDRAFETVEFDVTNILSQEQLIEELNNIYMGNTLIKIVLIGTRNFEIYINKVLNLIENNNILKMEDKTKIAYDLDILKEQNTLTGIFVKNMLEKIKENPEKEDEIRKALEIGLDVLKN